MNRCFRYILKLILGPLLIIVGSLSAVVWLSQSLRFVDFVLNRGLPAYYILWIALLIVPSVLGGILPIALFIAIVFTYTKLTMDSELVVFRAAGKSNSSLSSPALATALAVTILCYAVNIYFLPMSQRQFKELQTKIRADYSAVLLEEGTFQQLVPSVTVYIAKREPDGELDGILIHDTRNPEKPVTMIAARGALSRLSDNSIRILLMNGNRQVVNRRRNELSLLYFDRYIFDPHPAHEEAGPRFRDPGERSLHELFWPGNTPDDIRNAGRFRAEGHQRLASPLLAIAYAFVGLATVLSGEFNRRGQSRRIIIAVGLVAAVQIAFLGLVNASALVPVLQPVIYLLPILTIGVACWLLFRNSLDVFFTHKPLQAFE